MKCKDILNKVKDLRQSTNHQEVYDRIWEVDADLWDKLISNSYVDMERPEKYIYGEDDDTDVIIDDKYRDLYINYILAKDDMDYQDTESYTNHMILYNSMLDECKAEFRSNHRQKTDYQIKY